MEEWKDGTEERKSRLSEADGMGNAIAYYAATCRTFCGFAFVLQRVGSQQIASVDSIHRNIAEGYCRRSLKEYLRFLNIALASAGESVSGLHAFHAAKQIAHVDF